ncbi:MAG: GAF domain-containing protein [Planctomycetota bacterium]|jgi:signal transduction histidine kinase
MFLLGRRSGRPDRREEEIRLLLETLPLAASKAKDTSRALVAVVRKLCSVFGWDYGEAWVPSRDGSVLKPGPVWPRTNPTYHTFRMASRRLGFLPGVDLAGRVWKECDPIWLEDLSETPTESFTRRPIALETGFGSAVALPIVSGVDVRAVVVLYRLQPSELDERDLSGLASALAPLGPVLARKQIEVELTSREVQQKAVARLGLMAMAETTALDDLRQEAVRLAATTLRVGHASLLELRDDKRTFVLRAGVGWREGVVGEYEVIGSQAGYTLSSGKPVIVQDLDREDRFPPSSLLTEHGVVSGLSVIVHGHTKPFGVLAVHGQLRRSFNKDDVHFLQALANILGAARERALAESELDGHRRHLETLVEQRSTQLEQSHERLRIAERMASIGTLAAGLGHDLGNTILPVLCRLDALEAHSLNDAAREDLAAVRQAVEYLRQLSQGLRLFALDPEKEAASLAATNLRDWWRSVSPLLRNALGKRVELKGEFPAGLPAVAVPAHRLSQAVLNLVSNAGEAIEGAGGVYVWAEPLPESRQVRLGVADTGKGMSPEVRRHSLDPFFTTKKRGLSTGLGLALVHAVAQSCGGEVEIESTAGSGTTILITLPVAEHATAEPEAEETVASISFADPRTAAYAELLMRSMGIEVIASAEGGPGDTQLWITEPTAEAISTARHYVQEDSRRRVVFFGERTDAARESGFVFVDRRRGPDAMRRSLRQVVFQLLEKDDDIENDSRAVRG